MKPLEISIKNFKSITEQVNFTYPRDGITAFTGQNGSGKSTLATDAIICALYGPASLAPNTRTGNATGRLLNTNATDGHIIFDFEHDGTTYRVQRYFSQAHNGTTPGIAQEKAVELSQKTDNGQWITLAGKKTDVNKRIITITGLTADQFMATYAARHGELHHFMHLKPAEKRQFLDNLLGLGTTIDDMKKRTSADIRDIKEHLTELTAHSRELDGQQRGLTEALDPDLAHMTDTELNQRINELNHATEQAEQAHQEALTSWNQRTEELEHSINELENERQHHENARYEATQLAYQAINDTQQQLRDAQRDIEHAQEAINTINQAQTHAEEAQKRANEAQERAEKAQKQVEKEQEHINQLTTTEKTLNDTKEKIVNDLAHARADLTHYTTDTEHRTDQLKHAINQANQAIEQATTEHHNRLNQLTERQDQLNTTIEEHNRLTERLTELTTDQEQAHRAIEQAATDNNEAEKALTQTQEHINQLTETLGHKRARVNQLTEDLTATQGNTGHTQCYACHQPMTEHHTQDLINRLEHTRDEAQQHVTETQQALNHERARLTELKHTKETTQKQENEAQARLRKLHHDIDTTHTMLTTLPHANQLTDDLKKVTEELTQEKEWTINPDLTDTLDRARTELTTWTSTRDTGHLTDHIQDLNQHLTDTNQALTDTRHSLEQANQAKQGAHTMIHEANQTIEHAQETIKRAQHLNHTRETTETTLMKARTEHTDLTGKLASQITERDQLTHHTWDKHGELNQLKETLKHHTNNPPTHDTSTQDTIKHLTHEKDTRDRINHTQTTISQAQQQIKDDTHRATNELARLTLAKHTLDPAQAPTLIFTTILNQLTDTMNNILTNTLGATYQVSVHTDTNDLNLTITRHNRTYDFDTLSGGEKVRFSIAFRLALHQTLTRTHGPGAVLILDESLAELDDDGINDTLTELTHLSHTTPVMIVTHDRTVSNLSHHTITVTRDDTGSHYTR